MSFIIAVPLGTLAAYLASKGNGAFDQGLTMGAMVIDMIPGFWLALVLLLVVSLKMGLLSATGPMDWGDPVSLVKRMMLPVIVLSIVSVGGGPAQLFLTERRLRDRGLGSLRIARYSCLLS